MGLSSEQVRKWFERVAPELTGQLRTLEWPYTIESAAGVPPWGGVKVECEDGVSSLRVDVGCVPGCEIRGATDQYDTWEKLFETVRKGVLRLLHDLKKCRSLPDMIPRVACDIRPIGPTGAVRVYTYDSVPNDTHMDIL